MATYGFATLDPRQFGKDPKVVEAATAANDTIFALGPVLGIEVTVPALAQSCSLGNIDPQHSGGDVSLAAIEVAMTWPLPSEGAVLVTVRSDLDSVGAMAVLALRAEGLLEQRERDHDAWHDAFTGEYDDCPYWTYDSDFWHQDEKARILAIAAVDKFAAGAWSGPKPMPRKGEKPATAEVENGLPTGLSRLIMDFKVPLAKRVELMKQFLLTGDCFGLTEANVAAQAEWDRAVERTTVWAVYDRVDDLHPLREFVCGPDDLVELAGNPPQVAYCESTERFATAFAYRTAPVIVCQHPSFSFQGAAPGRKYTVAQYELGYVDLAAVKDELSALEPGWGGSQTIIGSPQGTASALEPEMVMQVVLKHLLKK